MDAKQFLKDRPAISKRALSIAIGAHPKAVQGWVNGTSWGLGVAKVALLEKELEKYGFKKGEI